MFPRIFVCWEIQNVISLEIGSLRVITWKRPPLHGGGPSDRDAQERRWAAERGSEGRVYKPGVGVGTASWREAATWNPAADTLTLDFWPRKWGRVSVGGFVPFACGCLKVEDAQFIPARTRGMWWEWRAWRCLASGRVFWQDRPPRSAQPGVQPRVVSSWRWAPRQAHACEDPGAGPDGLSCWL